MSSDLSGEITAIATAVLAVFAIVTAFYAIRAFRKQSQEVSDQAAMLRVQSERLAEQRSLNAEQVKVLALQSAELRESLDERKREAEKQRRSQAVRVTAWFADDRHGTWGARVCNDSDLPVIDVRTFFNYIAEKGPGGDWEPQPRVGPIEKIRVLPPRTDRFIEIPEQVRSQMNEVSDSIYSVSIEFIDAAGNHWERDPRGALVPLT
jgi:hypothetical protein